MAELHVDVSVKEARLVDNCIAEELGIVRQRLRLKGSVVGREADLRKKGFHAHCKRDELGIDVDVERKEEAHWSG